LTRKIAAEGERHDADSCGRIDAPQISKAPAWRSVSTRAQKRIATARPVKDQARHAARGEIGHAAEVLDLLGYVKTVEKQHDRSLAAARCPLGVHDDAGQVGSFIRHLDMLDARPRHQSGRLFECLHAAHIGGLRFGGFGLRETFADVIVVRGTQQVSRGGQRVAFRGFGVADRFEAFRFGGPLVKPCDVVAIAVFQTQADAMDFVDFGAAPRCAAQRDQYAMRPAVIARIVCKRKFAVRQRGSRHECSPK
jgi:hypothetical protein